MGDSEGDITRTQAVPKEAERRVSGRVAGQHILTFALTKAAREDVDWQPSLPSVACKEGRQVERFDRAIFNR